MQLSLHYCQKLTNPNVPQGQQKTLFFVFKCDANLSEILYSRVADFTPGLARQGSNLNSVNKITENTWASQDLLTQFISLCCGTGKIRIRRNTYAALRKAEYRWHLNHRPPSSRLVWDCILFLREESEPLHFVSFGYQCNSRECHTDVAMIMRGKHNISKDGFSRVSHLLQRLLCNWPSRPRIRWHKRAQIVEMGSHLKLQNSGHLTWPLYESRPAWLDYWQTLKALTKAYLQVISTSKETVTATKVSSWDTLVSNPNHTA